DAGTGRTRRSRRGAARSFCNRRSGPASDCRGARVGNPRAGYNPAPGPISLIDPLFGGLFALFVFARLNSFQAFFAAFGALRGALDQLGTDQFEHGLLSTVALAPAQPDNARIAAIALAEPRAEPIEQFLHRSRC